MNPFILNSMASCYLSPNDYIGEFPGSAAFNRALLLSSLYKRHLYAMQQKSPPAVKRSFSQLDLDCDDVIVASSHHARFLSSSSGHERDSWCDRLMPSSQSPPTYGSCNIEVPVDILRPVTGRTNGHHKFPRLEGGFLGGATTKNADYYCTSAEADTTRKCASTQTQFSSFQLPPATTNQQLHIPAGGGSFLPPPYPSAPLTSRQHSNSSPRQPSDFELERHGLAPELLPPTYVSTNLSSIASSHADNDDHMNLPLNLTVRHDGPCSMTTNAGTTAPDGITSQFNAVQTVLSRQKQSVVTSCSQSDPLLLQPWAKALPFVQRRQETHHRDASPCLRLKEPAHRSTSSAVISDCCQEIEEHFLRSLGRHYLSTTSTSSSGNSAAVAATSIEAQPRKSHSMTLPNERYDVIGDDATTTFCGDRTPSNISVNGSVDDHFAKSLGATWSRIKEHLEMTSDATTTINSNSSSGINQRQQVLAPLGGTVDDHFAKALGDAWFKIKAETERI